MNPINPINPKPYNHNKDAAYITTGRTVGLGPSAIVPRYGSRSVRTRAIWDDQVDHDPDVGSISAQAARAASTESGKLTPVREAAKSPSERIAPWI